MWFSPKTELSPTPPDTENVWAALQAHRSLEQHRSQVIELEAKLDRSIALSRLSVGLLSIVVILSGLFTGWNIYQLQQYRHAIEQTEPQ